MANPLARVIMNNMVQNNKSFSEKNVKNAYSVSNLSQREEQLLLNIMKKDSRSFNRTTVTSNRNTISNSLSSLNLSQSKPIQSKQPVLENNRKNMFEKVRLEDLVKGNANNASKSRNTTSIKTNTMMTLNDLAGKAKKPNESQINSEIRQENQNKAKDIYVKTGVINNLEAYIPKVSLNSIGKKGSLL